MKEKAVFFDKKYEKWYGVNRELIDWFPKIKEDKCIGCGLCFVTCGREVFDFDEKRKLPIVARPYQCMVGCSTCAVCCPSNAIEFPGKDLVLEAERKFKILRKVPERMKVKQIQIALHKAEYEKEEIVREGEALLFRFAFRDFNPELFEIFEKVREKGCQVVDFKFEAPLVEQGFPACLDFRLVSRQGTWPGNCPEVIEQEFKKKDAVLMEKRAG